jgi:hypothetical protein
MSLRTSVERLLDVLRDLAPLLESPPHRDYLPRQFAAAGLMRCGALLRGICVLQDADLGPVTGILERQHWETCLVSLHVVLRGQEALKELAGDDIHYKRLLSKELALGLKYQDDWDDAIGKLNVKKLADALGPLLVAAEEPGDPDGRTAYNVVYRVQSLFAVHANVATIHSYMSHWNYGMGVVLKPPAPFPRPTQTPALSTIHLAGYVLKAFARQDGRLDAIWDDIIKAAEE